MYAHYLVHVVENVNGVTAITPARVVVKRSAVEKRLAAEHDILANAALFNFDAILCM